jgi:hypothetical protein
MLTERTGPRPPDQHRRSVGDLAVCRRHAVSERNLGSRRWAAAQRAWNFGGSGRVGSKGEGVAAFKEVNIGRLKQAVTEMACGRPMLHP